MKSFPFRDRQNYIDHNSLEEALECDYDVVQVKYDGNWARIEVEDDGLAHWYSRTAKEKKTDRINLDPGTYIGEYMFGTQWAQKEERRGKTYLFDIIRDRDWDISNLSYARRKSILYSRVLALSEGQKQFEVVVDIDIKLARECWNRVLLGGYEGLVFRRTQDDYSGTLGRLKRECEADYFVVDVVEGKDRLAGTLGALVVSPNNDGSGDVRPVGGGFSDEQRRDIWENWPRDKGKVSVIRGSGFFDSGAMRHPRFIRFKDE